MSPLLVITYILQLFFLNFSKADVIFLYVNLSIPNKIIFLFLSSILSSNILSRLKLLKFLFDNLKFNNENSSAIDDV